MFFELKPDGIDEILKDGFCRLKFPQFKHKGQIYFTRIVFRPGFETSAVRLKKIVTDKSRGILPEREHEIEKILSYTPDQVNAFIRHVTQKNP